MFRRLAWLGKLIAAGLIISFLSIWTTGYIVTSYVETLLKQFNLPVEVPPMAMSGVWGNLWGSDPLLVSDVESKENQTADEEAAGEQAEPEAEEAFGEIEEAPITDIGGGGGSQAAREAAEEAPVAGTEEGAAGVPGEGAGGAEGEPDGSETAVTTEELEAAKDEMSQEDKELLFDLIMSKLPEEAWLSISEYMEEGLTEQELTSVEQIMAQHLDTEEYEQMMEILKKY
ncbi:hypothetical protein D3P08_13595 [Paenibacillus nanensis]|uniref:Spore coat protein n=1 Tax=Paenibacillus nanensis TaxID=393251 RepID=A0A3A1UX66_9BACL|nr:hypothetical protein [Paenibacillus nanensis]RIX52011.1 hypothetical protein D3P08_13595 [Paenibacillus nanensis]